MSQTLAMQRTPEPELMDDPAQALAYARADFEEPNAAFVAHFAALLPDFERGTIVDLGCGPGDIALRLAARYPAAHVVGVDGAASMLTLAREALAARPALQGRVSFVQALIGATLPEVDRADVVVCNSLLHHLAEASLLWRALPRLARPGAALLVMDLARPDSVADAARIVAAHAAGEPEILRHYYYNSMLAAHTP